jgi:hypothetical protein
MKKRGNPLWGKQLESAQVIGPTEFEKLVKKSLLDAFGIHVDGTF